MNHSDKSGRLSEALGYLVKRADVFNTAVDAVDTGVNALAAVDAYKGGVGAYNALRAGQGAAQATQAFAQPFAPVATSTAGKVFARVAAPVGVVLAGVDTYSQASAQAAKARQYGSTGQRYWGTEGSLWDSAGTVGVALPLAGAAIGTVLGGPVGTAAGVGIGYAAQLGLQGAKWFGQRATGYDAAKDDRAASRMSATNNYNNAAEYAAAGMEADRRVSDTTSTSMFGRKRDFQAERLNSYLEQERKNRQRSNTNPDQVA